MALKTFTATRAVAAGDSKRLASWHLSGAAAAVVNFCDKDSGTPIFQVQLALNTSASQAYNSPLTFPNGLHIEVVSGALNRGAIDLV